MNDANQQIIRLIWVSVIVVVLVALFVLSIVMSQQSDRSAEPIEDSLELPVVPATSVEVPAFHFTDITSLAGIEFTHVNGSYGERLLPETMGSGIAFFDYDLDGDQDLLLLNSTHWPWHPYEATQAHTSKLYNNDGLGNFTDVTAHTLNLDVYGMGVAVGDYDGDTYPDVFITAVGENKLLRNVEGKQFQDVTSEVNLSGATNDWSTCATFFDFDGDLDLDLFVCNYVEWSREIDQSVNFQLTGIGRAYGPPTDFGGTQNKLYRNDLGTFVDVSDQSGIYVNHRTTQQPVGKALAVLPLDIDGDVDTDLVIANDTVRNFIYINQGDGTFIEDGIRRGIAFDSGGAATGAMGIDASYIGSEHFLAIAIGNFANEMTSFYVRRGQSDLFSDDAIVSGIGAPSRATLTFGVLFADFDLDGKDEFLSLNGHVEPEINRVQSSQQFKQPPQLFWACSGSCPRQYLEATAIGDLKNPKAGRALSAADIDGDGDLDLAISEVGGDFVLLRNDYSGSNSWVRINLIYREKNLQGLNAQVSVYTDVGSQKKEVTPTKSYLSQVELPLTFGLGVATHIVKIEVRWPDGTLDTYENLATNRVHSLKATQNPLGVGTESQK